MRDPSIVELPTAQSSVCGVFLIHEDGAESKLELGLAVRVKVGQTIRVGRVRRQLCRR